MGSEPDQLGWLKLVLAPDLGPGTLDGLEIQPADYPALPDWSDRDLQHAGLSREFIRAIKNPDPVRLDAALRWLDHPSHHLVSLNDEYYPPLLRRIADAPLALFVNGSPEWFLRPQIAIVGSRNATPGGLSIAREFSEDLSRAGLVITSGLALGVQALTLPTGTVAAIFQKHCLISLSHILNYIMYFCIFCCLNDVLIRDSPVQQR